jgi:hypothetical protein
MRKRTILTSLIAMLMIFTAQLFAQVGINNDNSVPDPSAMLDVKSSNKGVLIPRMNIAQRNAVVSPANGLMIYNTECNELQYFSAPTSGWKSVAFDTTGYMFALTPWVRSNFEPRITHHQWFDTTQYFGGSLPYPYLMDRDSANVLIKRSLMVGSPIDWGTSATLGVYGSFNIYTPLSSGAYDPLSTMGQFKVDGSGMVFMGQATSGLPASSPGVTSIAEIRSSSGYHSDLALKLAENYNDNATYLWCIRSEGTLDAPLPVHNY